MSDMDDEDTQYVEVTVRRIARLAETSPDKAASVIMALREAGYAARDIDRAIEAAVRSASDRVADECDAARAMSATMEGVMAATRLLAATEAPLGVLAALGGHDDPVALGARDRVARIVDYNVATYAKWHATDRSGGPLLIRAKHLATSPSTRSAIDKHLRIYRRRSQAALHADYRRRLAERRANVPRTPTTVRSDWWADDASRPEGPGLRGVLYHGNVGWVGAVSFVLFIVFAWGVPIGLVIFLVRWLIG
jgi:hypothetical protein